MEARVAVDTPTVIRREDYTPPDYLVDTVNLDLDLMPSETTVTATSAMRLNPDSKGNVSSISLSAQHMEIDTVSVDGVLLPSQAWRHDGETLEIGAPEAEAFDLTIVSRIKPHENTRLEGLYMSGGMYCTQCEAEGFRTITPFPDRPDVMAIYTTTLRADKALFPILLSNGNPTSAGDLPDGRHFATWDDPWPKPSYLFAAVAGDLGVVEDSFTTRSGREVALRIYVELGEEHLCGHAMESLKRSMRWDEEAYGLEYDLDLFMIVAVSHFNMGAMENKGLNIFNSSCILADPETATDADFRRVEAIVAHEYFHNWTGNRITCRDWFQLSLKEGLTVYREQEFVSDTHSRAVQRIGDVRMLRSAQFPEDAGPLAHPIRPESYIEINNFYTMTVYEKGAEVVRMIRALVGVDGFRKGMDLYVQRHDGTAATCDDFVSAMADANGVDLSHFQRWYGQAGTPVLTVSMSHDPGSETLTLTVGQSTPATPGQPDKQPLTIPLAFGLIDRNGDELPLEGIDGTVGDSSATTAIVPITETEQKIIVENVPNAPVPSLLRGFSAPVTLKAELDDDALYFLMAHDRDAFVRWDSGQTAALRMMLSSVDAVARGEVMPAVDPRLINALTRTLEDASLDAAFRAEALRLPGSADLGRAMEVIDVDGIDAVQTATRRAVGRQLRDGLLSTYKTFSTAHPATDFSTEAMAERDLANVCLSYLVAGGEPDDIALAAAQARETSMTAVMAALVALNEVDDPARQTALAAFENRWIDTPLVLDKWFSLKAGTGLPRVHEDVLALLSHPKFDMGRPNRVRAVVGAFSRNQVRFHEADGRGHRFLADILIDLQGRNPQVAARLAQPLARWRRFDPIRQASMRKELERIAATPDLSKDVYEVVSKSLA